MIGLFQPARYKVYWGGRGASRSWSFARALLIRGGQQRLRVLCCREFQKSIADSVHKLLTDQIELLNLPGWQVLKKSLVHSGTGTEIIFEGLRYNTNRIKSLEGIDICWIEEAESVSKDSWEIIIPTIRKEGSEIWISFNPHLETDPTYQRFVANTPPNAIVRKVGWEDNPWFPETLREEKDYLYRVDPDAAEHIWGGQPRKSSAAQVLAGKWKVEAFDVHKTWTGPLYGADFGYSTDPTALIECYIARDQLTPKHSLGRLMIRRESWKVGLDTHRIRGRWSADISPQLSKFKIRADSARPETISYLNSHGYPHMVPVFKWPGSVEDGIAYLRAFEDIVIHPDCPHTKLEAYLWSYKVDEKTLEVTTKLIDKHNHTWDAIRYALQAMIRARRRPRNTYSGVTYHGR
jgi:phage terminase large subunit